MNPPPPTPGRRRGMLAALVGGSLLFALLLGECALRVKAYFDDRELDIFQNLDGVNVVHDSASRVRLRNIIRLNDHPRIIYELIPNLHATFKGAILATNERGFRGPVLEYSKPSDTVRIAGLGDSIQFGWGVLEGEYYLAALVRMLAESHPQISWEMVNSAVPGYNTAMEVETLQQKLLAYDPDLVIIDYVPNDLGLPNYIRRPSPYFTLRKSYLYKQIRVVRRGLTRAPDDRLEAGPSDPDDVPEEYAVIVGIDAYRRAMAKLKRLSLEHGFEVVVFVHGAMCDAVRETCEELGFPVISALDLRERFLREHGIDEYDGSPLTLSDEDPHPSPLAHELYAGLIYDFLVSSGIAAELAAAAR